MTQKSFVRKKVKSLTLGEKLRQLREDRRLRVYDLSRKINVKDAYINALENGNYDLLPTKVYVKGFVRSYARYFGVPEELLLSLFEREYSVFHNINTKDEEETVSKLPKVPRFVLTPRVLMMFVGICALFAIGVYLYFGVENFISSPWLVIEDPVHNSIVQGNTVTVRGKTRNNSHVRINGQQIYVDMDGTFADDVVLSAGTNVIRVSSVNKFNKETVQEIMVEAQYEVEQTSVQNENKKYRLHVQARTTPVTIIVQADGNDVFSGEIAVDEKRIFDANEIFMISSDEGQNTFWSIDDINYAPITEKGGPVTQWQYPLLEDDEVSQENEQDVKDAVQKTDTKKKKDQKS